MSELYKRKREIKPKDVEYNCLFNNEICSDEDCVHGQCSSIN